MNDVPDEQKAKILCGRQHFAALGASGGTEFAYVAPVKDFSSFTTAVTPVASSEMEGDALPLAAESDGNGYQA